MADIKVGNIIAARRKELGLTQLRLAELMEVSEQAVKNWENGTTEPGKGRFSILSDVLGMPESALRGETQFYFAPGNVGEHLFSEKHMYSFIKGYASSKNWTNTLSALKYARSSHDGQTRKGDFAIPYITHPLNIACHAMSLEIEEDELIAAALLHDVCEDCDILPEELPVSEEVQEAEKDLQQRRARRGKTDPEDGHRLHSAEEDRQRNSHAEGAGDALHHDEAGLGKAVEKADEAKQK